MNARRFALGAFVLLVLLQVGIVAWKIADCARFLKTGAPAVFACAADWGAGDRISLALYKTQCPYDGGIEAVDTFIRERPGMKPARDSVGFYNRPQFARYPVRIAPDAGGLWRIVACGPRALDEKQGGLLTYARLCEYSDKTKQLTFRFPFDYFYVRDSALPQIRRALRLDWKDRERPECYKGRLQVRFGRDGRWQIEDLLLDGKSLSDPANLPEPASDGKGD